MFSSLRNFIIGEIVSSYDVGQFIKDIHYSKMDWLEGNLKEHIEEYDNYEVKEVFTKDLEEPSYYIDEELVEEYQKKDIQNMPPIVLGFYLDGTFQIIEAGHRVTVAKMKNAKKILAFVAIL